MRCLKRRLVLPEYDHGHKIIVGIDYGTTYSGISTVTTDLDAGQIDIVRNWPGAPFSVWKTPTAIAYQRENPGLKSDQWGFKVNSKHVSYWWTKMLLDKDAAVGEFDEPLGSDPIRFIKTPLLRTAEEVCEDYLRLLFEFVSQKLIMEMGQTCFDMTPMECWITLPAIWSDSAKQATLNAAKNSGFGGRPFDEVFTISEPEAAAIATLKMYAEPDAMNLVKPGERILICDCGGGTVDITTYQVTSLSPYMDFQELCVGIGGKCGSTSINRHFERLMKRSFGSAYTRIPEAERRLRSRFMQSFELAKFNFGIVDDGQEIEICNVKMNIPTSKYYDHEEKIVFLSRSDMEVLFDLVIVQITNLLDEQIKRLQKEHKASVDRIVLVGGFAESAYLCKKLETWCNKNGGIMLLCPKNLQAAVVEGAAIRGLEQIAPRIKYARRHYGFRYAEKFREGIDPAEFRYIDMLDEVMCRNKLNWVINKGD